MKNLIRKWLLVTALLLGMILPELTPVVSYAETEKIVNTVADSASDITVSGSVSDITVPGSVSDITVPGSVSDITVPGSVSELLEPEISITEPGTEEVTEPEEEITESGADVSVPGSAMDILEPGTEEAEPGTVEEVLETEVTEPGTEEEVPESETEPVAEVQVITGFDDLPSYAKEIHGFIDEKPSLDELTAQMPEVIGVYLDGSSSLSYIPVEWVCDGCDYETSPFHYYQFFPVWDDTLYDLTDEIDLLYTNVYVSVFLASGNGASLLASLEDNEREIYRFCINQLGMNAAAACGILANIYCESAFDPLCSKESDVSYGLCQWYSNRKTNLFNWCNNNGYDYRTVEGQLRFLKYELENTYTSIYSYMKKVANTSDGAYDAGYYWCYNFEIPANTESQSRTRGSLAVNTYWPKYYNDSAELGVPDLVSVSNVSAGVKVKWKVAAEANGYYIYRKTGSGSWKKVGSTKKGTKVTFTDTTAESGTNYSYTVASYLATGSSEYDTYEVNTGLNYRSGPGTSYTKLGAWVEGTLVNVVPGYSEKADGYVWYKIAYNGDYVYAAAEYLDLVSYASEGSVSTVSKKASSKSILYVACPGQPSVKNTVKGVRICWKSTSGVKGFYIYRKHLDGDWKKIKTVNDGSATEYYDTEAESGTFYYYRVRSFSGSTQSGYKTSDSFGCLDATSIKSVSSYDTYLRIKWTEVKGADGYIVYKKTSEGLKKIKRIKDARTTYYDYTKMKDGEGAKWVVRAYFDDDIMSGYRSTGIHYFLKTPKLAGLSSSDTGVQVTWITTAGADAYAIYRKEENGKFKRIGSVAPGSESSYLDETVADGVTYTYRVRALKGNCRSGYDEPLSTAGKKTFAEYVTTDGVNYRVGPGTDYDVAGALPQGTKVKVVAGYQKEANGHVWYKILVDGEYYYAASEYLEKV